MNIVRFAGRLLVVAGIASCFLKGGTAQAQNYFIDAGSTVYYNDPSYNISGTNASGGTWSALGGPLAAPNQAGGQSYQTASAEYVNQPVGVAFPKLFDVSWSDTTWYWDPQGSGLPPADYDAVFEMGYLGTASAIWNDPTLTISSAFVSTAFTGTSSGPSHTGGVYSPTTPSVNLLWTDREPRFGGSFISESVRSEMYRGSSVDAYASGGSAYGEISDQYTNSVFPDY